MGVESLAESEGEVTRVGGKGGCRFAEREEHVTVALEHGREHITRVPDGSGVTLKNLPHCDVCF